MTNRAVALVLSGIALFRLIKVAASSTSGWTVDSSSGSSSNEAPANWQLFAADGPSPLERGVLVASAAYEDRVIGEATHTVQGHPAALRATGNSLVPAGALELEWDDGEAFHDVIAVGLEEDELIEITPKTIRLRKRVLTANDRKKAARAARVADAS